VNGTELRKFAVICFFVCLGLIVVAFWPRKIATLRCADGSILTVRAVTFGTNHVWTKRGFGRTVRSEWNSETPTMAIWGTWDGRQPEAHSFRFELIHEVGRRPWATLKRRTENFRPGRQAGLLATATNSPGMLLCVRVSEETEGKRPRPTAEFMVKNERLIKERSKRSSRWSVRLNAPRFWSLRTQLMIANEYTTNEILMEKFCNFGPLVVCQKFD